LNRNLLSLKLNEALKLKIILMKLQLLNLTCWKLVWIRLRKRIWPKLKSTKSHLFNLLRLNQYLRTPKELRPETDKIQICALKWTRSMLKLLT